MNPYLEPMYLANLGAKHVALDMAKVLEQGQLLAFENFEIPAWKEGVFPSDEMWMDFIFWTNSINFAFTDFKTGRSYELEYPAGCANKGAYGMMAAFKRAMDGGLPVMDARFWKDISEERFAEIFKGSSTLSMMGERMENLKHNGRVLAERYGGKVENIFKKSNFSCFNGRRCSGLIEILTNEFSFFDSNLYRLPGGPEPIMISFNKRAQLLCMMYAARAMRDGQGILPELKGWEYLSLPADYRTPQALRAMQIIKYSPELSEKIEQGKMISAGSPEEVEIRFQSIIAAEELKTWINALRLGAGPQEITILELDYFLWSYGRKLGSEGQKHHLTETTAY